MKMLSKENLIARTSDIGFCLGLLVGKIWVVGFVIVAFSANAMDPKEFDGLQPVALKRRAKEVLSERNALFARVEELQEQLAAAQSGRQTPSDIAASEFKCQLEYVLSEDQLMIEKKIENVKTSSSFWAICCGERTTS